MLLNSCIEEGVEYKTISYLNLKKTNHGWTVGSDRGGFKAKILVDATGRNRVVSTFLRIKSIIFDNLICSSFKFNVGLDFDISKILTESTPCGWWFSCSIKGRKQTVSFFTDTDLLKKMGINNLSNLQLEFITEYLAEYLGQANYY